MTNPFEMLALPLQFALDLKVLEAAYFRAQAQLHPDQIHDAMAMQMASAVNEAYILLKDPIQRAEVLLRILSPDKAEMHALPEQLEEIFLWREKIEQAREDGALLEIFVKDLQQIFENSIEKLNQIFGDQDFQKAGQVIERLKFLQKTLLALKKIKHESLAE